MKTLKHLIFLGITFSICLFISCQKEFSIEPLALRGSIVQMNGVCASSSGGNFNTGIALSNSGYVDLQVNITETGTYHIKSDTINGISFNGIGDITSLGNHTIRIYANGTPTAAGSNVFTFTFDNTVCTVDVLVTDPSANAIFSVGNGSGCTGNTTNGTYTESTALNATNTIEATVDVTSIGAYTINTDLVNGISFSASGDFTTTGSQVVQLIGSGTPNASGNTSFIISGGGTTCSFSINILPASPSAAVYTFDATGGNCNNVTFNGSYLTGVAMTSANTAIVNVNVTTPGSYTLSSSTLNGVSFSASGNFINTGAQSIILTATGTPTATGSFEYDFPGVTNGCGFEVEYTTPGNNAVFTFGGSPGACSNYVLSGDYWETVMFNSSHYVILEVNVTHPGAYDISTTENGITFAATGNFTTTGNQTVKLIPSGTLAAYMYSTYTVTAGGSSCTFDIDYEPAYYLLLTDNGNCVNPVFSGTYSVGVPLTNANTISVNVHVGKTGPYSLWSTTANGISFIKVGTFTTTGPQTVTLTGAGTPIAAGVFDIEIGTYAQQVCDIHVTVN